MNLIRSHWNSIFACTEDAKLGWYEQEVSQTLELLDRIGEWNQPLTFFPGVGTSVLVEKLLDRGASLILNDISEEALQKVKNRLEHRANSIRWLCQDVGSPLPSEIREIDLWVDRAVLHFLTKEEEIRTYFENVKLSLKPGAHALFAEFSKDGAEVCAGMPVCHYSLDDLSDRLGSSFRLKYSADYNYVNPFGEQRPYLYALYQRQDDKIID